jgi:hypothetical protein
MGNQVLILGRDFKAEEKARARQLVKLVTAQIHFLERNLFLEKEACLLILLMIPKQVRYLNRRRQMT